MTDEQTIDVEAADDMDIQIAKRLFDTVTHSTGVVHVWSAKRTKWTNIPRYTIDAAEQVVVAMTKRGLQFSMRCHEVAVGEIYWYVTFWDSYNRNGHAEGTGPTPAPFICRAALQAVTAEREHNELSVAATPPNRRRMSDD